jgi:hypothetical protein
LAYLLIFGPWAILLAYRPVGPFTPSQPFTFGLSSGAEETVAPSDRVKLPPPTLGFVSGASLRIT